MGKIDLTRSELTINGGIPVRTKPWLDNFTTGEEEKLAAIRVLDKGYLSLFEGSYTPDAPFSFVGGPEVLALEMEWSTYYGVTHSVSMNSATSGLYAAVGALGIGYGDEVIVSPFTMSACALAPMIYGAIPVFADVESGTGCLDPESIGQRITPHTKAIIVVHQFGFPANMDAIMSLAKKHNLYVIEDCAQAHGAKYNGTSVGTIGNIGVFSLNVNKTIQTGEGGVCVTNDADIAYRLQLIRNHGEAVVGPAGYERITNIAGFNYRMTELNAALAREQLKKLPKLNQERMILVDALSQGLVGYDFLSIPMPLPKCCASYYVYPIIFKPEIAGVTRDAFIKAINAEGALFYQGYTRPLYLQPVYQKKNLYKYGYPFSAKENSNCYVNYQEGVCPKAEQMHFSEIIINEHIRLPHMISDIDDLLEIIKKVAF